MKQTAVLLGLAFEGMSRRLGSSLVVIIGITCAVGVLVSMLSIGAGIDAMALKNTRVDRVMVRGAGSDMLTELSPDVIQVIKDAPGIKKGADGQPLVSADVSVVVQGRRRSDNSKASLSMIGVGLKFREVYPELRIIDGRMFHAGLNEIIVGGSAQKAFRGLEIGAHLTYRGTRWAVVGVFDAGGGLEESWLLTDADTLKAAFNRGGYEHVTLLLDSPISMGLVSAALDSVPTVNVDVLPEAKVRRQDSKGLNELVNFLSYFVGSIMAIGATVGALSSMYSIVDARQRDLAILRALGFGSRSIAIAVVIEALLLAIPGALVGVLVPWLIFNGEAASYRDLSFSLVVNPPLAAVGVAWALMMGLIGGLLPSLRAARVPIARTIQAA